MQKRTRLASRSAASPAFAGDFNNANVLQLSAAGSGDGNALSIDQGAGSGTTIQGIDGKLLSIIPPTFGGLWASRWITSAISDLSLKTTNDVATAKQIGEANNATVRASGDGSTIELFQSVRPFARFAAGAAYGGNTATITTDGSALGGVIQIGALNQA